jgi:ABC-type Zn uptake system ZnuABC Zn-binding protein ZnuA
MERWGLVVMGYVEPRPGIPPSPSHTIELITAMKAQDVRVIIVEPYFDKKTPQAIATQVGGTVVELAPSVGAFPDAKDYITLFDYNVKLLVEALGRTARR